jgi:alkylation response protein AidB-like acyl-CoA dehydrogenase
MNGQAHFNEVFFTDARVSNDDLIGGEGQGWAAAVATLAFERSGLSSRVPGLTVALPGEKGGVLDRRVGDVVAEPSDTGLGSRAFRSSSEIAGLAADRPGPGGTRLDDPVLRQELMELRTLSRVANWSAQRAREAARAGQSPGSAANVAKLMGSHIGRASQHLAPRAVGPEGMLAGDDAPAGGQVTEMVLSVPSSSIAGGTDEVQRNIIGERGLGLPKDVSVDREVPFREVPRSSS